MWKEEHVILLKIDFLSFLPLLQRFATHFYRKLTIESEKFTDRKTMVSEKNIFQIKG